MKDSHFSITLSLLLSNVPQWLKGKESACNAEAKGDLGSIPGSGRSPGGGNGNPLQYSCLENSMDRGDWQAIVHEVEKSWTRLKRLSPTAAMLCRVTKIPVVTFCYSCWISGLFIVPWHSVFACDIFYFRSMSSYL